MDSRRPQVAEATVSRTEFLNAFMRSVYNWMGIGLVVTAAASFYTLSNGALLEAIVMNKIVFFGLLIAELGLVFAISGLISRLSAAMATGLFVLYSVLNGVTLSVYALVYTSSSIAGAFVTAAGMFIAISIYGLITKRSLTSVGSFCAMGLIGVLIAMVVNFFLQSTMMNFIISCVGVVVFVGLTAYDTQKLRDMGESAPMDDATAIRRGVILGALTLYLDFINLFIMLLRLMGDRK